MVSVQLVGPVRQLLFPPKDLPNSSPVFTNHRLAPIPQLTGRGRMGREWFKTCWLLSRWPCRRHTFSTWWNESALRLPPSTSFIHPGGGPPSCHVLFNYPWPPTVIPIPIGTLLFTLVFLDPLWKNERFVLCCRMSLCPLRKQMTLFVL